MQMKLIVLALLVGSMVAVSPAAAGQHYDDTLHNNLSIKMRKTETDADVVFTNPIIAPLAQNQIMKLCLDNMPSSDFFKMKSKINQIIKSAKKSDSHTTFHTFAAFMDHQVSEARTYELTIIRNENSLVGVLSKKTHIIESSDVNEFYSDIYTSDFGLKFNFTEQTSLKNLELDEDTVNYMRQYLLRSAEQVRKTPMNSEHQLKSFTAYAMAAAECIKALTEAAKGIISIFKTVKTTTLKEHIKGEGFKAYKASSSYSRILGVPLSKYTTFLPHFITQMGFDDVPQAKQMKAYFEIAEFASNEWKLNDFVFGIGKKNNICNNLVITNTLDYTDMVVHFVAVKVNGSFELADDTLVYTQYKSIIGGLSETTKDVRKNIPRDIKDDEIKAINALMVLNAINVYSDEMNIKFSLPSDDPWKM